MPTTYANTINGNPIYAARAVADKDGSQIDTTYLKKADYAQSDWEESVNTEPDYIKNKPQGKDLVAGTGITISTTSSAVTVAADTTVLQAKLTDINNVLVVNALPASPAANTLYLIPE